jgi:plasmid stabilization system protein ParE
MPNLSFHPEASAEFHSALVWYSQRNRRAAERFDRAIHRILESIAGNPQAFPLYDDRHREAILTRYPYSVLYRIEPTGEVLVVAVAHASREPGYWLNRS